MSELREIVISIQDKLVPILDSYEQAVYHYIFRHTYLEDRREMIFITATAEIGYGSGDKTKKPSKKTRSDRIRSLEEKGCIRVIERTNLGIKVEILLPDEIIILNSEEEKDLPLDINLLDFYRNKRLLSTLLARENNRCFYTGRKVASDTCCLDHVIPQALGGDNSFKNIVVASHDVNTLKREMSVQDFIRFLYKEDIINLVEMKELKSKVKRLKNGEIAPDIQGVKNALRS